MEAFDANDQAHQEFRAIAETLVGLELDPAIDLTEPVDLREKRSEAS